MSARHLMGSLTLVLLCAGTPLAQGPTPAPPAADIESRLPTARLALQASGAADLMLTAIRANLPAQRAAMPNVPEEFWTRIEQRVTEEAPQLTDEIASLYARMFTQAELDALLAFHQSPAGKRFRELQPALMAESAAIGQKWGRQIGEEVASSLSAPR